MLTHVLFFYCSADGIQANDLSHNVNRGDIVLFCTDSSTDSGVDIMIMNEEIFGPELSKFVVKDGNAVARRVLENAQTGEFTYQFGSQKCNDNQQGSFIIKG